MKQFIMHLTIKPASSLAKVSEEMICFGFYSALEMRLGGESIKEINRKSGAFVELDKSYTPSVGNSSDRLFKIRGTPDQIVLAQQLMFEKVFNSASGAGDMVTPIQFQQQFNLPLVGSGHSDAWGGAGDPYATDANGAAASDPYSLWASTYGQWPQGKKIYIIRRKNPLRFCCRKSV
jgi:hypothetical protein